MQGRARLLAAMVACAALPAYALTPAAHRILADKGLRPVLTPANVLSPTDEQFVAFYRWLGGAMAHKSDDPRDGDDPKRFVARFPGPFKFDAFGIRGFLGLSQEPTPAVWGLEDFDRATGADRFNMAVKGAAIPDVDARNQNRVAYDDRRAVQKDSDGKPLPADPLVLAFGDALIGPPSQLHAHCYLPDAPTATQGLAAQMAQAHLDLAILARAWGDMEQTQCGDYMAMIWWSAGLHYVQDAADPLHTVPAQGAALAELAELAQAAWMKTAAKTAGGYAGTLPTQARLQQVLARNAGAVCEQWFERELDRLASRKPAAAALAQAWTQTDADDRELLAALGDRLHPHMTGAFQTQPFESGAGQILVEALAKLARRDAGALLRAAAMAMHGRWRGAELRKDGAPLQADDFADGQDAAAAEALGELAILQARTLRRATTAARIYWAAFEQGNVDAAARRLRRSQLDYLDARDARLAAFRNAPKPVPEPATEQVLWVLAAELGALAVAVALIGRMARRRKAGAA